VHGGGRGARGPARGRVSWWVPGDAALQLLTSQKPKANSTVPIMMAPWNTPPMPSSRVTALRRVMAVLLVGLGALVTSYTFRNTSSPCCSGSAPAACSNVMVRAGWLHGLCERAVLQGVGCR
jgi:hypothetical protein